MPAATLPTGQDSGAAWSVGASLALHALALMVALAWRSAALPVPEVAISVELLSPQQFEAETEAGEPAVAAIAPADSTDDMIRPATMLSAAALADPKSRQAREMLPQFEPTERAIQLCDIEAMEQVHAWRDSFVPERLVAYATADVVVAGSDIRAEGAAFFSGGAWYGMRFDCELSADRRRVIAFAFSVGSPIPRAHWEAHSLPSGGEPE